MKLKKLSKTQRLTLSGLFAALGLIAPFSLSHAFGVAGTVLLPMHIPVFLCGLVCGPLYGCMLGLMLPLLNSVLTSMPAMYPMVPIMTAELAVYGTVSGLLFFKTPLSNRPIGIYISMICAMVAGRVAYGAVFYLLLLGNAELRAPTVLAALLTGIPGILIQLLTVPPTVLLMDRYWLKCVM